jgi:hypothetical protein
MSFANWRAVAQPAQLVPAPVLPPQPKVKVKVLRPLHAKGRIVRAGEVVELEAGDAVSIAAVGRGEILK